MDDTTAYCIAFTDPDLYRTAVARAHGRPEDVKPDEAWVTEDAATLEQARSLALIRSR